MGTLSTTHKSRQNQFLTHNHRETESSKSH